MAKTIECWIHRSRINLHFGNLGFGEDGNLGPLRWDELCKLFPTFTKGLRPGQSRKLILTQTKRGIKLEVKK
jgi:hypothetical protein